MTEQQWLASIDPAAMYAFIRDLVTERQQRFFVEACRANSEGSWGLDIWADRFSEWCNFCEKYSPTKAGRTSLLREIIGNPFDNIKERLYVERPLGMAVPPTGWKPSIQLLEWLQWNNATIPNLIREMTEEECNECESGCVRCDKCNMTGHVPRAEPLWDMMPLIADALESAGCTEAAILDHLRGTGPHVRGCWCVELLSGAS